MDCKALNGLTTSYSLSFKVTDDDENVCALTRFHGMVCVGIRSSFRMEYSNLILWNPLTDDHKISKMEKAAKEGGTKADIQPVAVTTDTIVENVALLQPRRQRKRKTVVDDAGGPSHPPKKLREDYGDLGGASTAGKSMFAVQSLFTGAVLNAEARDDPIPTLPFVTSFVSATPEHSSHHFGANIAEAEVDSIVRSSAPSIATVTTVTTTIDADATAARAPVVPSLFAVGSSSTGRTDSVPGGFFDVSSSDFLIGGIRTISLNAEVRMRAEYNLKEKWKLRAVVDEQAELLKVKDGEIESLKAQLLLKEAEVAEAIHLRAEVFKFEAAEQSFRGEVRVLRDHGVALEREKNELSVKVTDLSASIKVIELKVHELEISSVGLHEKVDAYEDFVGQLEKFQDEKLEEVNEKFDKLCADFVDMALHLKEKFYPHLLTTISGRRWLLTHGMELAVVKCLNSTKYLSALGAAISKVVEKGMQEGLSAGITHGAKGRKLADVAAYNPSAKADYLVDTIMNLLRLDDVLAKRLGLTEFQPHVNQLMVPIHHSPDQDVVGAFALSFSLEPFSAMALEGMKGTSGSTHDAITTLSATFVSASTIPPISTDDYEVTHADGQGVPV
nr:hypothetical protein [Tanacetum cinerariifolium]